jgi:long-chain fatty acid transport protein
LRFLRLTTAFSLTCLMAGSAFGSGFLIPEQGAKASAMAGAFAATADDPSAIFYNPAGIANQGETLTVLAGTTLINFTNEFTGDPNSEVTAGVKAEYNRHTFNVPNIYVVKRLGSSNLTLGVGVFAAFGLRTDWADPFPGRYISKDADLKTTSINPVVAYKVSDRLQIGGGVEYRRARVILNANSMALSPFAGRLVDIANTRLVSQYGDSIGWNAGVLFKPTEMIRIGASYRAAMDIDLDGDAEVSQIFTGVPQFDAFVSTLLPPDQPINTKFPFPSIASVGVAVSPTENWDVEVDVIRTGWSAFDALSVNFETTPSRSFVRTQNWEDSNSYRLGINHNATEHFDVRGGVLYDENPQPIEAVSPLLPDSDRLGATIGAGWHAGPLTVDGSLLVLHFKDRDTRGQNAEGFNGEYETDALLWSVNFGYRF